MTAKPVGQIELFVRAGQDGRTYGACPSCQQVFMILLHKAKMGLNFEFTVKAVNMANRPPAFREISTRVPALVHNDNVVDLTEKIIEYLDRILPTVEMRVADAKANEVCLNVFSRFSHLVRTDKGLDSQPAASLFNELRKIDNFIRQRNTAFLCGEHLTHIDCELLPKLHHIRVAAKALKNFEIPTEFEALWSYLSRAYKSDVFRKSCPSDQEIVFHWMEKTGKKPDATPNGVHYFSGKAQYSFDVPSMPNWNEKVVTV